MQSAIVECPGCGRWDVPVCADCARVFDGGPWRCEGGAPMLAAVPGESLVIHALEQNNPKPIFRNQSIVPIMQR